MWRLKAAGLALVAVTGRPAGWCDLIARQWPVDAVVGENGAVAFYEEGGTLQRLTHPEVADASIRGRLAAVRDDVLARVPGARLAKDQAFRIYDLAIDFAEEPPRLGLDAAYAIADIFAEHGAHAKVSSIHVNGWFGDYDKRSMAAFVLGRCLQRDAVSEADRFLYCGDSANDEPMFAAFPVSCGVANIMAFVRRMTALPRYVASLPSGAGFAEIADVVLQKRLEAARGAS